MSFQAANDAHAWVDTCTLLDNANPDWEAAGNAIIEVYNSGPISNTVGSTGQVLAYVPLDTILYPDLPPAVDMGGVGGGSYVRGGSQRAVQSRRTVVPKKRDER